MYLRWEADAYTSVSFSVPDNWQAGRIWVSVIIRLIEFATYNICCRPAETATSMIPIPLPNAWMVAATEVLNVTLRREQYGNSLSDLVYILI